MPYLTSKQIAERLNITDRRVRALAQARHIGEQLPDHTWVFTESDLKKFENRINGRPKQK